MKRAFLVLAMLVAAPSPVPAQPSAPDTTHLRVELGIHAGAVTAIGLDEFTAMAAGRLTLRLSWAVGTRVRLGLRAGLLGSYLPLGDEARDVAFLTPTLSFLFELRLWRWLAMDLTAGVAIPFGVDSTGTYGQPVSPTFGAGLIATFWRGRRVHLAVRLGFDALLISNHDWTPWLFHFLCGLLVRFPIQRAGPGLGRDEVPDPFEERFRRRRW